MKIVGIPKIKNEHCTDIIEKMITKLIVKVTVLSFHIFPTNQEKYLLPSIYWMKKLNDNVSEERKVSRKRH